jgi:hypothetical protein
MLQTREAEPGITPARRVKRQQNVRPPRNILLHETLLAVVQEISCVFPHSSVKTWAHSSRLKTDQKARNDPIFARIMSHSHMIYTVASGMTCKGV